MSQFNLNQNKCNSCGTCASNCPVGHMEMNNYPQQVPETSCSSCGHCEAGCSEGAIDISGPKLEPPLVNISSEISSEDMGNYMRNRRSIRNYKKNTIPREIIEEVMDIVRFAPSGVNQQPIKWIIIEDPEKVKVLAGLCIQWMEEISGIKFTFSPEYCLWNL